MGSRKGNKIKYGCPECGQIFAQLKKCREHCFKVHELKEVKTNVLRRVWLEGPGREQQAAPPPKSRAAQRQEAWAEEARDEVRAFRRNGGGLLENSDISDLEDGEFQDETAEDFLRGRKTSRNQSSSRARSRSRNRSDEKKKQQQRERERSWSPERRRIYRKAVLASDGEESSSDSGNERRKFGWAESSSEEEEDDEGFLPPPTRNGMSPTYPPWWVRRDGGLADRVLQPHELRGNKDALSIRPPWLGAYSAALQQEQQNGIANGLTGNSVLSSPSFSSSSSSSASSSSLPAANGASVGMSALAAEILDVCQWARLSQAELAARELIIEQITALARQAYGANAVVKPHGSSAVPGLAIFSSDLDLCVYDWVPPDQESMRSTHWFVVKWLRKLRNQFKKKTVTWASNVQFIPKARVPIIKLKHAPTGVEVDIMLDGSIDANTLYVLKSLTGRLSDFANLIPVMKTFLWQQKLDDLPSGGLGSFRLYCMLANVMDRAAKADPEAAKKLKLSDLFLHFLDYYSRPENLNSETELRVQPSLDNPELVETNFTPVWRVPCIRKAFAVAAAELRRYLEKLDALGASRAAQGILQRIIDCRTLPDHRQQCVERARRFITSYNASMRKGQQPNGAPKAQQASSSRKNKKKEKKKTKKQQSTKKTAAAAGEEEEREEGEQQNGVSGDSEEEEQEEEEEESDPYESELDEDYATAASDAETDSVGSSTADLSLNLKGRNNSNTSSSNSNAALLSSPSSPSTAERSEEAGAGKKEGRAATAAEKGKQPKQKKKSKKEKKTTSTKEKVKQDGTAEEGTGKKRSKSPKSKGKQSKKGHQASKEGEQQQEQPSSDNDTTPYNLRSGTKKKAQKKSKQQQASKAAQPTAVGAAENGEIPKKSKKKKKTKKKKKMTKGGDSSEKKKGTKRKRSEKAEDGTPGSSMKKRSTKKTKKARKDTGSENA